METGATSPAVILSYYAKAELIGLGGEFAVFEGRFSHAGGNDYRFERTGRVAVYKVRTGTVVSEFNKPELTGEGTVLCVSSRGSLAAYARGHDVLAVDFSTANIKRLATVGDLPQLGYLGACGLAERASP